MPADLQESKQTLGYRVIEDSVSVAADPSTSKVEISCNTEEGVFLTIHTDPATFGEMCRRFVNCLAE
jgi:hypothetical protein